MVFNSFRLSTDLLDSVDALLPQTQCTKCGYDGCRPYAQAIVEEQADINQCPPGGIAGIRKLARLLGRSEKPLNPANGEFVPRAAAVIDEAHCIGCTLCIRACPVDAIVGAARRMHTVLTQFCTGCELCIAPCPVDCIDMVAIGTLARNGNPHAVHLLHQTVEEMAPIARERYRFRQLREPHEQAEREDRLARKARTGRADLEHRSGADDFERKKNAVRSAIERARAAREAAAATIKADGTKPQ